MSLEAVETDLLAVIAADPDAIEPRLVYADRLQAIDDPRGELIVVQAGLLAKPDDTVLRERERELCKQLTSALIDNQPFSSSLIVRWHLGFVDAVSLDAKTIRMLRTTHREWFRQPAFAAVREVEIDSKYARTLRSIGRLGIANTVRRLKFGDTREALQEPAIAALAARLPNVVALYLRASEVPPLAALRGLRELTLVIGTLTDPGIARIMEVPWRLESFGLETVNSVPDDMYPVLAQLYNGATLPTVKHFVVGGAVRVMPIIETLATSKRAQTIESLTGDFHRAPYDEQVRAERHREVLANVTFKPVLGISEYNDVEGLTSLGSFLNYRLSRPAEALAYYEHALRLRPDNTYARQNLGVALRKLQRFDESLIAFDTIIQQSKAPTAAMYNGRYYTLCELGRRDDARRDLERAVELDPAFADGWNNLGVERQYVGDAEGALAAFRRCSQLNPEHNYSVKNEADLLLELGLAGEALPIYSRLLAAKPTERPLLTMIAHAQIELGHAEAARATIDTRFADPEQPRHPQLFALRALALRDLGQLAPARADLDACAHRTDCPAWFALGVFIRSLDEAALWARVVPETAITSREIADAVSAYAARARPSDATVLHEATLDDQMDCSELAVAAALRAGNRDLAVQRARAVATFYTEQGPRFFRKWWQTLATVVAVANRDLDEDGRALLALVIRAVRGRRRIADVIGLGN